MGERVGRTKEVKRMERFGMGSAGKERDSWRGGRHLPADMPQSAHSGGLHSSLRQSHGVEDRGGKDRAGFLCIFQPFALLEKRLTL